MPKCGELAHRRGRTKSRSRFKKSYTMVIISWRPVAGLEHGCVVSLLTLVCFPVGPSEAVAAQLVLQFPDPGAL